MQEAQGKGITAASGHTLGEVCDLLRHWPPSPTVHREGISLANPETQPLGQGAAEAASETAEQQAD